MNERKHILKFIDQVANNNLKQAHSSLAAIINEKLKNRIVAADKQLAKDK